MRRSCRSPSVRRTPSASWLSSRRSGSRWFHSETGRTSIRRPCRTVTSLRAASARITSRAVVFETPNSSQMSCSVGGTPRSPLTILPARTRVTWSLSLRGRALLIVAWVVWSSVDLTADRTAAARRVSRSASHRRRHRDATDPAGRRGDAAARRPGRAAGDHRCRVRGTHRRSPRRGRRRPGGRLRRPRACREPDLPLQPRPALRGGPARARAGPPDAPRRQGGHRLLGDRPDRRRRRPLPVAEPDGDRPKRRPDGGAGPARGGTRRGRPDRRRRLEGASRRTRRAARSRRSSPPRPSSTCCARSRARPSSSST